MRALVIDDSRVMRRIVASTLKGLGFEIAEAGTGAQRSTCSRPVNASTWRASTGTCP